MDFQDILNLIRVHLTLYTIFKSLNQKSFLLEIKTSISKMCINFPEL